MYRIKVGTKIIIESTKYIIKKYEHPKGDYYVVESISWGNLNGSFDSLDSLIDHLEYTIGRFAIRKAIKGKELYFKIEL